MGRSAVRDFQNFSAAFEKMMRELGEGSLFDDSSFTAKQQETELAFYDVWWRAQDTLDLIKGVMPYNGPVQGQYPLIRFSNKVLSKGINDYSEAIGDKIDIAVDQTYFVGFLLYCLQWTHRPRGKSQVNMDDLKGVFTTTLFFDHQMQDLSNDPGSLSERLFQKQFEEHVLPVLIHDVKIGFFKKSRAINFFRNLFYFGLNLGMGYFVFAKDEEPSLSK